MTTPPIALDDAASLLEDNARLTIGSKTLILNDSDAEGSPLVIVGVDDSDTIGTAVYDPDADTVVYDGRGLFEFLAEGETATDSFAYTIEDEDGNQATALVVVTITGQNDAPFAPDEEVSTTEDGPPVASELLEDAFDADGEIIFVSKVEGSAAAVGVETTLASGALVTVQADGTYVYDPNDQFNFVRVGDEFFDSVTVEISDGVGGVSEVTSVIRLIGVNDPLVAGEAPLSAKEDGPAATITLNEVLAVVSDPDGVPESYEIFEFELDAPNLVGTAIFDADKGILSYDPAGGFETLAEGQTATDRVPFTARNGDGEQTTGAVLVTVTGQNDAPTAADDVFAGSEIERTNNLYEPILGNDSDIDGPRGDLVIDSVSTAGTKGAVLFDKDTQTLIYDPNAKFDFLVEGGAPGIDTFEVTIVDAFGDKDTSVVTIEIAGVADAPPVGGSPPDFDERTEIAIEVTEDTPFDLDALLLVDDRDLGENIRWDFDETDANLLPTRGVVEGVPFVVPSIDKVGNTPTGIEYIPNLNETGTDVFVIRATDSAGLTATLKVDVTILPVNDAPVFTEGATASLTLPEDSVDVDLTSLLEVFDPDDGDRLSWRIVTAPANGETNLFLNVRETVEAAKLEPTTEIDPVTPTTKLLYTPNPDFFGSDSLIVEVTDDQETAQITINLTVTPVEDDPTAIDDVVEVGEDGRVGENEILSLDVLENDFDVDGDFIRVDLFGPFKDGIGTLVFEPELRLDADLNSGAFVQLVQDGDVFYDPLDAFDFLLDGETAEDSFQYAIIDTTDRISFGRVTLTIEGENDVPVIEGDRTVTIESVPVVPVTAEDLIGVDPDATQDELIFFVSNATNGFLARTSDPEAVAIEIASSEIAAGEIIFVLANPQMRMGSFDVELKDPQGLSTGPVTIQVAENDPPTARVDDVTTPADQVLNGNAFFNDFDPNGDPFVVTAVDGLAEAVDAPLILPSGAILTVGNDGFFAYDPNGAFDVLLPGESALDVATYAVLDARGGVAESEIQVTVTGVDDLPTVIVDPELGQTGEDGIIRVLENSRGVAAVSAFDPDPGDDPDLVILGGPDAADFLVDPLTGDLIFAARADFEAPADANGDNFYEITVAARDGAVTGDSRALTIEILDLVGDETDPRTVEDRAVIVPGYFNPSASDFLFSVSPEEQAALDASPAFDDEPLDLLTLNAADAGLGGSELVFRFVNLETGTHFFTIDPVERDAVIADPRFQFEAAVFSAFPEAFDGATAIVRFFDLNRGSHFYTTAAVGTSQFFDPASFRFEGIAFYVYDVEGEPLFDLTAPVTLTAFDNLAAGGELLTATASERAALDASPDFLADPDFAIQVFPSDRVGLEDSVPVFRLFDPTTGSYVFTDDPDERDALFGQARFEGVGFGGVLEETAGAVPVFRLRDPITGDLTYAPGEEARDAGVADGLADDGVAFFGLPIDAIA